MFFLIGFIIFQDLRPLQYVDPLNRIPASYVNYAASQTEMPFTYQVMSTRAGERQDLIVIMVNDSLYPKITVALDQYAADLAAEGYATLLIKALGGTPADIRNLLIAQVPNDLIGAVLIGDLPVAWWEAGAYGEDYPVDLFFSDLNGSWVDANSNGIYDQHGGSPQPDIWVGRLHASRLTYDSEARLVNNYFAVNHRYRTGALTLPEKGLVYNEVTWYPNDHGMGNLYSDVTLVNGENTTTAYDYKNRLGQEFQFVHLVAHSSCWAHTFFLQDELPGGGSVFSFEIPFVNPKAFFLLLNCCMAARFTETDDLANWYVFSNDYTQAVIASSSLMYGINNMGGFYGALASDSTIGSAFKQWHRANYSSFMGTLILGDPSLKVLDRAPVNAPAKKPRYTGKVSPDWTAYQVENSPFVNGHPALGYGQDKLWIFWDSGRIVRSDTYGSFFNGSGFAPPESIAWHEYYDFFPVAATDHSGRLWVAWQSFRDYTNYYDHFNIYTAYLFNNSWSSPRHVPPMTGRHDVQPALAAGDDDTVWIAFKSYRDGNANIYVSNAAGGGAWINSYALTQTPGNETDPAIAVDRNGNVWVFWTAAGTGHFRVQGRKYTGTWQDIFTIDASPADDAAPQAAVDSLNRVWLVWHRWINGQGEIYFACHDGDAWSPPAPVTEDPADDLLPSITIDGYGRPWICWMSDRDGDWNVYCSRNEDGWSLPDAVTTDPAEDIDPVITSDGQSRVWIGWASNRNGYWNIFASHTDVTALQEREPSACGREGVLVTPNPFRHSILFESGGPIEIKIYDTGGRLVTASRGDEKTFRWSPAGLNPGVYFARIVKSGGQECVKIIRVE